MCEKQTELGIALGASHRFTTIKIYNGNKRSNSVVFPFQNGTTFEIQLRDK